MADTKVTALTAIGTLGADDLFYVVDDPLGSPLSRKATGTQVHGFTRNPVTNNTEALGTTALGWADLHLGSGGVINWVNGEITLTEASSNILSLAGGSLYVGGTSSAISGALTAITGGFAGTQLAFVSTDNNLGAADMAFVKTRSTSADGGTIVAWDDYVGVLNFYGDDGAGFSKLAEIDVRVDGTPGDGDMPGRISFLTTPNASASPVEAMRIDSAQTVSVGVPGTGIATLHPDGATTPVFEVIGNSTATGTLGIYRYGAVASAAALVFSKSRHATPGSHTIVAASDEVGSLLFTASDGTDFEPVAKISAFVDGTPGAGDMPGSLVFLTTADTAEALSNRFAITNTGRLISYSTGQVAHFWVYWTGGSTTILASHNVTSIDNDATGDAGINLTTAFSSANYAAFVNTNDTTNGWDNEECQSSGINVHTAGVVDVLCSTITDGTTAACSLTNPDQWQACGFGVSA